MVELYSRAGSLLLINLATLLQLIIFAVAIVALGVPKLRFRSLLLIIFAAFAVSKFDDSWQLSGLALVYPQWTFIGALGGLVVGPSVYLYVLSRTREDFRLRPRHLLHLLWLLPPLAYLALIWWPLTPEQMIRAFVDGTLSNPIVLLIGPAYGDLLLTAYLALGIAELRRHGVALQQWFSNVEDRNLAGLRNLLSMFLLMVVLHLIWVWARGWVIDAQLSWLTMLLLSGYHLVLINGLYIEACTNPAAPEPVEAASEEVHAADAELSALCEAAEAQMNSKQSYLNPDLTVAALAYSLRVSPRLLSQAINHCRGQNFYEFVNRFRVAAAQRRLVDSPSESILEIAYACGFNTKSSFNTAFKRFAEMTPSGYRRSQRV